MDIGEFKDRLQKARDAIVEDRPRETLRISLNLLDAVRGRIQGGGINSAQMPFPPYSKGYAKSRKRAGYQVTYVDFTRTGRLWANVRPFIVEQAETFVIVEISARNPDLQDILNWQATKPKDDPRGNILLPTQKELNFVELAHLERIQKHLKILVE